jgi:hypothetical protein
MIDDCTAIVAFLDVAPTSTAKLTKPGVAGAGSSRPGSAKPGGPMAKAAAAPSGANARTSSTSMLQQLASPTGQAAAAAGLERPVLSAALPKHHQQPAAPPQAAAPQQLQKPPQAAKQAQGARHSAPDESATPQQLQGGQQPVASNPLRSLLSSPLARLTAFKEWRPHSKAVRAAEPQ